MKMDEMLPRVADESRENINAKGTTSILTGSNDAHPVSRLARKVMLTLPDDSKPKPSTAKSKKSAQPAQDAFKEIARCKEEKLIRLDLTKSNITSVPPSIKELGHLTELYLYGNKLTAVPLEIGELSSLQVLALHENSLTTLPSSMSGLVSLRILDLRHNKLQEVRSDARIHHFLISVTHSSPYDPR
ncbi:hypothetical protein RvY_19150 [Ramazzottius varieornatus]|uniref:Leucine-rich repeat protein SHOC-2 n=1 Tax=Ramazzottius varieornatus TaxID=947166 RepID=A0A1D1W8H7_RAMVA|nr:hypothetical protein RvY_19150 [Ramazzottius varieornatus]